MAGDLFGGLFGDSLLGDLGVGTDPAAATERMKRMNAESAKRRAEASKPKEGGPLPTLQGKRINGELYVSVRDLVSALESQGKRDWPLTAKLRGSL